MGSQWRERSTGVSYPFLVVLMRFVVVAATDVDIGQAVGKEQNRSTSFKFTLFLSFSLQTDDSA